jgi:hypothetical protein
MTTMDKKARDVASSVVRWCWSVERSRSLIVSIEGSYKQE